MPQFLVAIYHSADYDPSLESEVMHREIDDLNDAMVAEGVRVFVGGLHAVQTAHWLSPVPHGDSRPPARAEYMAGFWVLEVPNLDAALDWGRRAAAVCQARVEVRAFHGPTSQLV